MTFYICTPEIEAEVSAQCPDMTGLLVLQKGKPLVTQLLKVPDVNEVMVAVPPSWSDKDKEDLTLKVHDALLSIGISRNTIGAFLPEWIDNAFFNHDFHIESTPVNQIQPYPSGMAYVVGKGPSAGSYKFDRAWQNSCDVFVAWSAAGVWQNKIDYIGHCDHRGQVANGSSPEKGIILTPYASFEFSLLFWQHPRYLYIDRGNPVCGPFAKRYGVDHEPIVGHVVDMLAQCAIYAGHTKIKYVGCELSFATPEAFKQYRPDTELIPTLNYRGEVVYTDPVFEVYRKSLEGLAQRHPDIEFTNASDAGVIIEGVAYEP